MLTFPPEGIAKDNRPAYRPYRARVSAIEQLTPHFALVTFTGTDFSTFGTDRLDQRVKIVFPLDGVGLSDFGAEEDVDVLREGTWYSRWRELADEVRNPFRTYTVRGIRPERGELDIVFVDHGIGGPAARWLASAVAGDEVVIVGPDARSLDSAIGIDWHPGSATELLLAGDETAAPAICGILESLPDGVRARAFIEVPTAADVLEFRPGGDATATWIARTGAPLGERLGAAVRDWVHAHPQRIRPSLADAPAELEDTDVDRELLWDSPVSGSRGFYAWLAGESGVIKSLRRFLVSETGIDRGAVAFMGYWRQGKAEAQ